MSATGPDPRLDREFFVDLERALSAEFGARAFYARLARRRDDRELSSLLDGFHEEEVEQIERLRALTEALGGVALAHRRRRVLAAWVLAFGCRLGLRRVALRLCHDSETTLARSYSGFAAYLARAGDLEHARACEALAATKQRHALALEAWVPR